MIGVGTVALVIAVRWLNGVLRRRGARFPVPQHLVAVALMATLVWAFDLHQRPFKVAIVGHIPAALPSFEVPHVSWEHTRLLSGSAFAIALLGLLEAIAMAKAIAARTGQKLDINQQCISEGAANLAGSFFQCFPGSGSLTRSAVNQQAGAVSQWSGVFAAIAVAGTVLLFARLAQFIPLASLAGLLMLAAFRMVDREQLAFHLRATRFDAGVVIATAVAAVAISVEFCILIGVFLSFVLYVPRAAHARMTQLVRTPEGRIRPRQPGETVDDAMLIYHLEGELFFGTEPDLEAHCSRDRRCGPRQGARGHPRPPARTQPRRRVPQPAADARRAVAPARRQARPVRRRGRHGQGIRADRHPHADRRVPDPLRRATAPMARRPRAICSRTRRARPARAINRPTRPRRR